MIKNYDFPITKYKEDLLPLILEIDSEKKMNPDKYQKILRKYPKDGKGVFSRNQLVLAYRLFIKEGVIKESQDLLDKLKMKPTRTMSGVVPVTVLTRPFPCPGKCIFCPDDVRMPKSYLSNEPGAQRAERNLFDPYLQTYNRLLSFHSIGHSTAKVELIVLGGTWSSYPLAYRIWFIKRCFEAMNDFGERDRREPRELERGCDWDELIEQQIINENAKCRNVGLVLETRPDYIDEKEILNLRKLGATKIQIGIQSMDDFILDVNERGHSVKATIDAINLLREAAFKIHAHWMPNLYESSVEKDKADYLKIWEYAKPDELKIYPTSILRGTKLYEYFQQGKYKPFNFEELTDVLRFSFLNTPRYCRLTRVIRDIPAPDIVAGNKFSNLRQIVENQLLKDGEKCQCIRCREVRDTNLSESEIELEQIEYKTATTIEFFISYKTVTDDKLIGFLRLSLPIKKKNFIEELDDSALIREVHVYGQAMEIGVHETGRAQHLGIGTKLLTIARQISRDHDYKKISVISAIGTREYYAKKGFKKGDLYMHAEI
jgi:elongator complex protein 3